MKAAKLAVDHPSVAGQTQPALEEKLPAAGSGPRNAEALGSLGDQEPYAEAGIDAGDPAQTRRVFVGTCEVASCQGAWVLAAPCLAEGLVLHGTGDELAAAALVA